MNTRVRPAVAGVSVVLVLAGCGGSSTPSEAAAAAHAAVEQGTAREAAVTRVLADAGIDSFEEPIQGMGEAVCAGLGVGQTPAAFVPGVMQGAELDEQRAQIAVAAVIGAYCPDRTSAF